MCQCRSSGPVGGQPYSVPSQGSDDTLSTVLCAVAFRPSIWCRYHQQSGRGVVIKLLQAWKMSPTWRCRSASVCQPRRVPCHGQSKQGAKLGTIADLPEEVSTSRYTDRKRYRAYTTLHPRMHAGVDYPNMRRTASLTPPLTLCWSTQVRIAAIPCKACQRRERAVIREEEQA